MNRWSILPMALGLGVNEAGKAEDHHLVLKMAKGAPKVTISPDVLPCYILTPKGLDFVSEKAGSRIERKPAGDISANGGSPRPVDDFVAAGASKSNSVQ